ncbi:MAG: hypothetical protein IT436_14450 [Phycisphaerales bacterium]|nr:hypothetical protein [Phycisphaerales bacterium]
MDELKPSTWDRLRLYEFTAGPAHTSEPIEFRRMRRRIALVENVSVTSDTMLELKARANYWGMSVITLPAGPSPTPDPSGFQMVADAVGLLTATQAPEPVCRADDPMWKRLLLPSLWLVTMYACMLAFVTAWGLWLFGGMLVLGVIVTGASTRTRLRLARHLARAGHCPDCRYDLTGLPDAIPSHSASSIRTGPRLCPECGAAWPLIPPPVPVTPAAALPR